jgi:hypothetical protein
MHAGKTGGYNLLITQLLQTQCQATKKAESMTPHFLNLNQDIVA